MKTKVAVRVPTATGVNVTGTKAVPPGLTVSGRVPGFAANSPLLVPVTLTALMIKGAVPEFLTLTVVGELVVLRA